MNVVSSVPMRSSPALYNASASAAAFALVWIDALKSATSPRIAARITFFRSPLRSLLSTFTRSSPYFSWNVFFNSAISAFERAITTGTRQHLEQNAVVARALHPHRQTLLEQDAVSPPNQITLLHSLRQQQRRQRCLVRSCASAHALDLLRSRIDVCREPVPAATTVAELGSPLTPDVSVFELPDTLLVPATLSVARALTAPLDETLAFSSTEALMPMAAPLTEARESLMTVLELLTAAPLVEPDSDADAPNSTSAASNTDRSNWPYSPLATLWIRVRSSWPYRRMYTEQQRMLRAARKLRGDCAHQARIVFRNDGDERRLICAHAAFTGLVQRIRIRSSLRARVDRRVEVGHLATHSRQDHLLQIAAQHLEQNAVVARALHPHRQTLLEQDAVTPPNQITLLHSLRQQQRRQRCLVRSCASAHALDLLRSRIDVCREPVPAATTVAELGSPLTPDVSVFELPDTLLVPATLSVARALTAPLDETLAFSSTEALMPMAAPLTEARESLMTVLELLTAAPLVEPDSDADAPNSTSAASNTDRSNWPYSPLATLWIRVRSSWPYRRMYTEQQRMLRAARKLRGDCAHQARIVFRNDGDDRRLICAHAAFTGLVQRIRIRSSLRARVDRRVEVGHLATHSRQDHLLQIAAQHLEQNAVVARALHPHLFDSSSDASAASSEAAPVHTRWISCAAASMSAENVIDSKLLLPSRAWRVYRLRIAAVPAATTAAELGSTSAKQELLVVDVLWLGKPKLLEEPNDELRGAIEDRLTALRDQHIFITTGQLRRFLQHGGQNSCIGGVWDLPVLIGHFIDHQNTLELSELKTKVRPRTTSVSSLGTGGMHSRADHTASGSGRSDTDGSRRQATHLLLLIARNVLRRHRSLLRRGHLDNRLRLLGGLGCANTSVPTLKIILLKHLYLHRRALLAGLRLRLRRGLHLDRLHQLAAGRRRRARCRLHRLRHDAAVSLLRLEHLRLHRLAGGGTGLHARTDGATTRHGRRAAGRRREAALLDLGLLTRLCLHRRALLAGLRLRLRRGLHLDRLHQLAAGRRRRARCRLHRLRHDAAVSLLRLEHLRLHRLAGGGTGLHARTDGATTRHGRRAAGRRREAALLDLGLLTRLCLHRRALLAGLRLRLRRGLHLDRLHQLAAGRRRRTRCRLHRLRHDAAVSLLRLEHLRLHRLAGGGTGLHARTDGATTRHGRRAAGRRREAALLDLGLLTRLCLHRRGLHIDRLHQLAAGRRRRTRCRLHRLRHDAAVSLLRLEHLRLHRLAGGGTGLHARTDGATTRHGRRAAGRRREAALLDLGLLTRLCLHRRALLAGLRLRLRRGLHLDRLHQLAAGRRRRARCRLHRLRHDAAVSLLRLEHLRLHRLAGGGTGLHARTDGATARHGRRAAGRRREAALLDLGLLTRLRLHRRALLAGLRLRLRRGLHLDRLHQLAAGRRRRARCRLHRLRHDAAVSLLRLEHLRLHRLAGGGTGLHARTDGATTRHGRRAAGRRREAALLDLGLLTRLCLHRRALLAGLRLRLRRGLHLDRLHQLAAGRRRRARCRLHRLRHDAAVSLLRLEHLRLHRLAGGGTGLHARTDGATTRHGRRAAGRRREAALLDLGFLTRPRLHRRALLAGLRLRLRRGLHLDRLHQLAAGRRRLARCRLHRLRHDAAVSLLRLEHLRLHRLAGGGTGLHARTDGATTRHGRRAAGRRREAALLDLGLLTRLRLHRRALLAGLRLRLRRGLHLDRLHQLAAGRRRRARCRLHRLRHDAAVSLLRLEHLRLHRLAGGGTGLHARTDGATTRHGRRAAGRRREAALLDLGLLTRLRLHRRALLAGLRLRFRRGLHLDRLHQLAAGRRRRARCRLHRLRHDAAVSLLRLEHLRLHRLAGGGTGLHARTNGATTRHGRRAAGRRREAALLDLGLLTRLCLHRRALLAGLRLRLRRGLHLDRLHQLAAGRRRRARCRLHRLRHDAAVSLLRLEHLRLHRLAGGGTGLHARTDGATTRHGRRAAGRRREAALLDLGLLTRLRLHRRALLAGLRLRLRRGLHLDRLHQLAAGRRRRARCRLHRLRHDAAVSLLRLEHLRLHRLAGGGTGLHARTDGATTRHGRRAAGRRREAALLDLGLLTRLCLHRRALLAGLRLRLRRGLHLDRLHQLATGRCRRTRCRLHRLRHDAAVSLLRLEHLRLHRLAGGGTGLHARTDGATTRHGRRAAGRRREAALLDLGLLTRLCLHRRALLAGLRLRLRRGLHIDRLHQLATGRCRRTRCRLHRLRHDAAVSLLRLEHLRLHRLAGGGTGLHARTDGATTRHGRRAAGRRREAALLDLGLLTRLCLHRRALLAGLRLRLRRGFHLDRLHQLAARRRRRARCRLHRLRHDAAVSLLRLEHLRLHRLAGGGTGLHARTDGATTRHGRRAAGRRREAALLDLGLLTRLCLHRRGLHIDRLHQLAAGRRRRTRCRLHRLRHDAAVSLLRLEHLRLHRLAGGGTGLHARTDGATTRHGRRAAGSRREAALLDLGLLTRLRLHRRALLAGLRLRLRRGLHLDRLHQLAAGRRRRARCRLHRLRHDAAVSLLRLEHLRLHRLAGGGTGLHARTDGATTRHGRRAAGRRREAALLDLGLLTRLRLHRRALLAGLRLRLRRGLHIDRLHQLAAGRRRRTRCRLHRLRHDAAVSLLRLEHLRLHRLAGGGTGLHARTNGATTRHGRRAAGRRREAALLDLGLLTRLCLHRRALLAGLRLRLRRGLHIDRLHQLAAGRRRRTRCRLHRLRHDAAVSLLRLEHLRLHRLAGGGTGLHARTDGATTRHGRRAAGRRREAALLDLGLLTRLCLHRRALLAGLRLRLRRGLHLDRLHQLAARRRRRARCRLHRLRHDAAVSLLRLEHLRLHRLAGGGTGLHARTDGATTRHGRRAAGRRREAALLDLGLLTRLRLHRRALLAGLRLRLRRGLHLDRLHQLAAGRRRRTRCRLHRLRHDAAVSLLRLEHLRLHRLAGGGTGLHARTDGATTRHGRRAAGRRREAALLDLGLLTRLCLHRRALLAGLRLRLRRGLHLDRLHQLAAGRRRRTRCRLHRLRHDAAVSLLRLEHLRLHRLAGGGTGLHARTDGATTRHGRRAAGRRREAALLDLGLLTRLRLHRRALLAGLRLRLRRGLHLDRLHQLAAGRRRRTRCRLHRLHHDAAVSLLRLEHLRLHRLAGGGTGLHARTDGATTRHGRRAAGRRREAALLDLGLLTRLCLHRRALLAGLRLRLRRGLHLDRLHQLAARRRRRARCRLHRLRHDAAVSLLRLEHLRLHRLAGGGTGLHARTDGATTRHGRRAAGRRREAALLDLGLLTRLSPPSCSSRRTSSPSPSWSPPRSSSPARRWQTSTCALSSSPSSSRCCRQPPATGTPPSAPTRRGRRTGLHARTDGATTRHGRRAAGRRREAALLDLGLLTRLRLHRRALLAGLRLRLRRGLHLDRLHQLAAGRRRRARCRLHRLRHDAAVSLLRLEHLRLHRLAGGGTGLHARTDGATTRHGRRAAGRRREAALLDLGLLTRLCLHRRGLHIDRLHQLAAGRRRRTRCRLHRLRHDAAVSLLRLEHLRLHRLAGGGTGLHARTDGATTRHGRRAAGHRREAALLDLGLLTRLCLHRRALLAGLRLRLRRGFHLDRLHQLAARRRRRARCRLHRLRHDAAVSLLRLEHLRLHRLAGGGTGLHARTDGATTRHGRRAAGRRREAALLDLGLLTRLCLHRRGLHIDRLHQLAAGRRRRTRCRLHRLRHDAAVSLLRLEHLRLHRLAGGGTGLHARTDGATTRHGRRAAGSRREDALLDLGLLTRLRLHRRALLAGLRLRLRRGLHLDRLHQLAAGRRRRARCRLHRLRHDAAVSLLRLEHLRLHRLAGGGTGLHARTDGATTRHGRRAAGRRREAALLDLGLLTRLRLHRRALLAGLRLRLRRGLHIDRLHQLAAGRRRRTRCRLHRLRHDAAVSLLRLEHLRLHRLAGGGTGLHARTNGATTRHGRRAAGRRREAALLDLGLLRLSPRR
ncbi:hypothetical protein GN958_ATG12056 [Phytophthora infestans]|uniref:Uncharacterized protein n=1 Tax=Phytophthora infestans TaxID=4787 RepID=A0A8S9UDB5_PHYIN|nr:hypothetical protein GN958_ATG12056 [Phytophthora infestans]